MVEDIFELAPREGAAVGRLDTLGGAREGVKRGARRCGGVGLEDIRDTSLIRNGGAPVRREDVLREGLERRGATIDLEELSMEEGLVAARRG